MIIVMHPHATEEQFEHVKERVLELGYTPHVIRGVERIVIGAVGHEDKTPLQSLETTPGVEAVIPILKPYKLVSRDFKRAESCLLRVKGFKEVIDKHNKNAKSGPITIVAELPSGGDNDIGYKSTQDALQAHPSLAGIFAINDPAALGARAALEKEKKADQVKIVAFDGQPEGKQAIKDGKIYADPVQYPDKIGRETAKAIFKYFNGEKLPAEILIPTTLYRKADGDKDDSLK